MIKKIKEVVQEVDISKLSMQELYYYYLLLMELGLIFKEQTEEVGEREELQVEDYME